eukprot:3465316-Karenia_brevis.AAC.1
MAFLPEFGIAPLKSVWNNHLAVKARVFLKRPKFFKDLQFQLDKTSDFLVAGALNGSICPVSPPHWKTQALVNQVVGSYEM